MSPYSLHLQTIASRNITFKIQILAWKARISAEQLPSQLLRGYKAIGCGGSLSTSTSSLPSPLHHLLIGALPLPMPSTTKKISNVQVSLFHYEDPCGTFSYDPPLDVSWAPQAFFLLHYSPVWLVSCISSLREWFCLPDNLAKTRTSDPP